MRDPAEAMSERPAYETDDVGHPKRWQILAILNLSLVLIVAGVSGLNLAIPSIQRALDATASELVWINAAYSLVFAGLLLPAGALGDRYGRKPALLAGLGIFLVSALVATRSNNAAQLIALRGVMGVGAALTMPATLSIITVVFPSHERAKAIAIWSGFAGAGGALGILASGLLLEKFWWGSVFFVNVPIALLAMVLVFWMVPNSKDAEERPLDPIGSMLSIVGLSALVFGLIQGPEFGWTDPLVVSAFVASVAFLGGWVKFELMQQDPLLDPRLFKISQFGVGSFTITTAFLVMFGFFFVLTQYLQFVLDYTPLQAAVRTLPFAVAMVFVAPRGPGLAAKIGGGRTMALGMLVSTVGLGLLSFATVDTSYPRIAISIVLAAGGMALVFPTATEAIVSSLPQSKAGVASAMNDTTREVGGAIGIALLGTLLSSGYRSGLGSATDGLPPELAEAAQDNVGAALAVAGQVPGGEAVAAAARDAFVDGMQLSLIVAAAVMLASALVVARFFPRTSSSAMTGAADVEGIPSTS
ncbi:MAG: EmrB/QacA subfamily drug resistance transporter [Acidimicrobiales bacterium]|jgi:EmrB/QacA subfamily drug resistance transporter